MGDSSWAVTKDTERVGFEEDNGRGGLEIIPNKPVYRYSALALNVVELIGLDRRSVITLDVEKSIHSMSKELLQSVPKER